MRAVNLLPADQRVDTAIGGGRSQGGAYAILALLGGVALLALLYGMARHQASSRRAQVASLNARVQQVQGDAQRLAPYTSFVALREERVRAVAQLVEARFDWAHAFHELGRVLPSDASVTSLDGSVGSSSESASGSSSGSASSPAGKGSTGTSGSASSSAPSATSASSSSPSSTVASATPPGSVPVINLSGCATSQAEVARTLNRLRLIDGVSEVTLQSSTKTTSGGSGSGSGSSAAGQCSSGPAFTIQLTFEPLPAGGASAPSAAPAATGGAR